MLGWPVAFGDNRDRFGRCEAADEGLSFACRQSNNVYNAGECAGLAVINAFDSSTKGGGPPNGGVEHVRESNVEGEGCSAIDLAGDVVAFDVVADDRELFRRLQLRR